MSIKLTIPKIKCMGCVNTVKNALIEMKGVENVDIDLKSKEVLISTSGVDEETIRKILKEIGYPAAG